MWWGICCAKYGSPTYMISYTYLATKEVTYLKGCVRTFASVFQFISISSIKRDREPKIMSKTAPIEKPLFLSRFLCFCVLPSSYMATSCSFPNKILTKSEVGVGVLRDLSKSESSKFKINFKAASGFSFCEEVCLNLCQYMILIIIYKYQGKKLETAT